MYRVSILVPVYNAEQYIERCARSLFEQTYDNLEFVFVDDCSPDRSISILLDVVRDYPNRADQMRLVRNESNRGLATSRNITIEHASGEFLCFVDADDWLDLDAVELFVRKQQSSEADIVYGNALMHTSKGDSLLKEGDYADKHELMLCYSRFTPGYKMVLWRRLIRASLFSEHGIKAIAGLNYAEDKHLLPQVAFFADVICHLDTVIYHYNRLNEQSLVAIAHNGGFPLSVHLQEIGNMQGVVDFFRGRNDEYYSESSKALLRFLKVCMNDALSASSREGFYAMVDCINHSNPVFWGEIGWNSWKRKLYGNYWFSKFFPKVKRIVKRFIG